MGCKIGDVINFVLPIAHETESEESIQTKKVKWDSKLNQKS